MEQFIEPFDQILSFYESFESLHIKQLQLEL